MHCSMLCRVRAIQMEGMEGVQLAAGLPLIQLESESCMKDTSIASQSEMTTRVLTAHICTSLLMVILIPAGAYSGPA
jgi:hypothetical protein